MFWSCIVVYYESINREWEQGCYPLRADLFFSLRIISFLQKNYQRANLFFLLRIIKSGLILFIKDYQFFTKKLGLSVFYKNIISFLQKKTPKREKSRL